MRNWCGRIAAVVLGVVMSAAAVAGPRIVPAGEAEFKEISAVAAAMLTTLADADAAGAAAAFAGDEGQRALLRAHQDLGSAWGKLGRAMEAARVEDAEVLMLAKGYRGAIRSVIKTLPEQMLIVNGDDAALSGGDLFCEGLRLRRTGGAWRVVSLMPGGRREEAMARLIRGMATAVRAVEAGVAGGKLRSVEEVTRALYDETTDPLLAYGRSTLDRTTGVAGAWKSPIAAESLRGAIGKELHSREVTELIGSLPGLPYGSVHRDGISVVAESAGVQLGVRSDALARTVETMYLMAPGADGFEGYGGELPSGLSMTDTRADVERKLGRPPQSFGGADFEYCALYPRLGLAVTFATRSPRVMDKPIRDVRLERPDAGGAEAVRGPAGKPGRLGLRFVAAGAGAQADEMADPADATGRAKMLVEHAAVVDERDVAAVAGTVNGSGTAITLDLTPEGGKKLAAATKANIGRRLAIVLDGRALIAPTIRSEVGERVMIDMGSEEIEVTNRIANTIHAAAFSSGLGTKE
jgi:hypothetical protein